MSFRCLNVSSYKPDSVWSWFICFCCTLCMMLTLGFSFALGVLFPVFMDSFNESRERTAWVSSIIVAVCCFFGPLMGAFLNRFGIRVATIAGCLSCSAGLIMGSFASQKMIVILYLTFSLPFGIGISVIYVTATVIASHYFVKRRSFALGVLTAGQGLGTMILGPTLQALVDILDWRNSFRVFAGVLFVVSLTGVFLHQGTSSPNEREKPPPRKFKFNLNALKNPGVIIRMVLPAIYTFSRMVPYVHLIKHCDDLGISADKSSTLFLFIGIFATFGRLGGGLLCNIKCFKARLLYQVATFIMGASTMIMTRIKSYGPMAAYAIVFSAADGMTVTTYIIELLDSLEESKKASVFGFSMMFAGVGALSGPPLSGLMADRAGDYIGAFLMAGGVGVVGSLVPFALLCLKRESTNKYEIEETEDKEHNEDTNGRDRDEQELVSNSFKVDKPPKKRASSFLTMESSI